MLLVGMFLPMDDGAGNVVACSLNKIVFLSLT